MTKASNPWLVVCLMLVLGGSPSTLSTERQQQTDFNVNASTSEPLVKKSIPVPDAVLQILREDDTVRACMKDNAIPAGGSLASWFVGSEIHLSGPTEADLVVLPVAERNAYRCFHSAEGIGWFWIFRPIGQHYEMLLKASGLGLQVLETRHHGYRDIRTGGQVGKFGTEVIFRLIEGRYQEYRKKTSGQ